MTTKTTEQSERSTAAPASPADGALRLLSKDDILNSDDLRHEDVAVPEWGGTVRLRVLTGKERDAFDVSIMQGRGRDRELNLRNMRAKLVGLCLCDESGQRLFSDKEIDQLGNRSARALQRCFEVAQRLNGMTDDAVEELVGNSEGGQSADGGSDSLATLA